MVTLANTARLSLAICGFTAAHAGGVSAAETASFPQELMLDGKPVEPYCMEHFFGDSTRFEPVNLRQCGVDNVLPVENASVDKNGNYGYGYTYKDMGDGFINKPYIYYRYLGRRNDLPVLFLQESGGGSGKFSALVTVERQGDSLKLVEEIAAGDRCNGGLEASMNNDVLEYTQNVTPYDFLAIAGDNPHKLTAYNDLEASASSCFGSAHFVGGKLADITLTSDGQDAEGWTEKMPYQPCFNKLYRDTVQQGKNKLSKEELLNFTHSFNATCVDQPTKSAKTE